MTYPVSQTAADLLSDNDREIARLRTELLSELSLAATALYRAEVRLRDLLANHVYDVEFADTPRGDHVRQNVHQAAAQVAGAHAIVLAVTLADSARR
jgi:hypothetical protein